MQCLNGETQHVHLRGVFKDEMGLIGDRRHTPVTTIGRARIGSLGRALEVSKKYSTGDVPPW